MNPLGPVIRSTLARVAVASPASSNALSVAASKVPSCFRNAAVTAE